MSVLASDTFEGREAGSRGGRAAGIYLVEQLRRSHVLPIGDRNRSLKGQRNRSFYQEFGNGYRNVLAVLPGVDPNRKNEVVLIGAHYDHVGYGNRRNSRGPIGFIHNGADDNASGTAMLLEIVRAFSRLKTRPSRTVLFAFWDAEEKGMLGSGHWIKNPTLPLRHIAMVINLDMVGRLRNNRLEVIGSRSGTGWRQFLSKRNTKTRLHLHFPWTLKRDSDHYPFIAQQIPTAMFHTGKHADYHRPTDDTDKLNYAGSENVGRFVFRVAYAAANEPQLPRFRSAVWQEGEDERLQLTAPLPALPIRLGISWNRSSSRKGPLRIVRVTANSPAERAGLQSGDRIETFNGYRLQGKTNFRGLVMRATRAVTIRIRRHRAQSLTTLRVTMNGQPHRVGIAWDVDAAEPGVMILRRVIGGSPADVAGLHVGDRLLAVAGRRFRSSADFYKQITAAKPSLELRFERAGILQQTTLQLLQPASTDERKSKTAPRPKQRPVRNRTPSKQEK